jgi:hypothetical protein
MRKEIRQQNTKLVSTVGHLRLQVGSYEEKFGELKEQNTELAQ